MNYSSWNLLFGLFFPKLLSYMVKIVIQKSRKTLTELIIHKTRSPTPLHFGGGTVSILKHLQSVQILGFNIAHIKHTT